MNYITVEPEELKRRAKEVRAILTKNAELLKRCGFYPMTENTPDGKQRWCCGAVTIYIADHEFEKVVDVIAAVHQISYESGARMARDEMKRALRL